jgi:DNA modification methylase
LVASIAKSDVDVVAAGLIALSYVYECKEAEDLGKVLNADVIEKVCSALDSENKELKEAATYFSAVICRCEPSLVDKFMEKSPLEAIKKTLESETDEELLLDTYYIIINLVGVPYRFLKAVVDIGIGKTIINLLRNKLPSPKVRRIAQKCLKRILRYGRYEDIEILNKAKLLDVLVDLLNTKNPEDLKYGLKMLSYIMKQSAEEDELEGMIGDFDAAGGVEELLNIMNFPNETINKMANEVHDTYLYVRSLPEPIELN